MAHMTGGELRAARERAGLSAEDVAAEFDLTPAVVAAWEAGNVSIPGRVAQELAWRASLADRHGALATSGLPECEWVASWGRQRPWTDARDERRQSDALAAHMADCEVCRSRAHFLEETLPPLPPRPVPAWLGAIRWYFGTLERLPSWLRPVVTGAVVFAAISVLRILFALPRLSRTPGAWVAVPIALVVSAAAGAGAGLLYSGGRGLLRRMRARDAVGRHGPDEQVR